LGCALTGFVRDMIANKEEIEQHGDLVRTKMLLLLGIQLVNIIIFLSFYLMSNNVELPQVREARGRCLVASSGQSGGTE
jgi:hypothetical protein